LYNSTPFQTALTKKNFFEHFFAFSHKKEKKKERKKKERKKEKKGRKKEKKKTIRKLSIRKWKWQFDPTQPSQFFFSFFFLINANQSGSESVRSYDVTKLPSYRGSSKL
jgi:hypothetical protein